MAHRITVVVFPPSQLKAMKAEGVVSPFCKAVLFTDEGQTVGERVGEFQKETEHCNFQITEVYDLVTRSAA